MLKVELVGYNYLTEEEKSHQPDNGNGKEYANYIKISKEGETIRILSDAVEPEDATFSRDFNEVVDVIQLVYEIGKSDGYWEDR